MANRKNWNTPASALCSSNAPSDFFVVPDPSGYQLLQSHGINVIQNWPLGYVADGYGSGVFRGTDLSEW